MRQRSGDILYKTWRKDWHPQVSRHQTVLTLMAIAVAIGTMALYWLLVVSPQRDADLARLDLPHRPWYLDERPAVAARAIESAASPSAALQDGPANTSPRQQRFLLQRPNLVPRPEEWDPEKLRLAVLSYVNDKVQSDGSKANEQEPAADVVAQDLAERYAKDGAEAMQGEIENSLLAGGWLWNVWRGCEAEAYLSFPGKLIGDMGCTPEAFPAGAKIGLGVARWTGPLGESAPVFALVWRSAGVAGGAR